MIRIDRSKVPAPADLTEKDGIGPREIALFTKWIAAGRIKRDRPSFKAYKVPSVPLLLEKLFAKKCAYCESAYAQTQPVDVEHWRPKAEVETESGMVPGYEWLAADWGNLLPSCIHCNRQSTQKVLRSSDLNWEDKKIGKGNLFPVADEAKRLTSPDDPLTKEDPLLVNPCLEDPADFFRFLPEGVVVPKVGQPKDDLERKINRRALISIEVYALNRKALVDARHEHLLVVRSRFALISSLIGLEGRIERHALSLKDEPIKKVEVEQWLNVLKDLREREINEIVAMAAPARPYSLMIRQFVTDFLHSIQNSVTNTVGPQLPRAVP
jgi:uncharacterized protein (TIGR02646 family)